jgi:hypothetical protein
VVATCYLLGVSTRRMEKLVDALGITRLSKSQVIPVGAGPVNPLFLLLIFFLGVVRLLVGASR